MPKGLTHVRGGYLTEYSLKQGGKKWLSEATLRIAVFSGMAKLDAASGFSVQGVHDLGRRS